MKTVCKKLLCLMLVAMMLVSAIPAAFATEGSPMVQFYIQLWVGDECKVNDPVSVPEGTIMDLAAVQAYATQHLEHLGAGEYFGAGYEIESTKDLGQPAANNGGAAVYFKAVATHTHTEDAGTVTTQPTCHTEGVKTFKCSDASCGETLRTEPVAATNNHVYGTDGKCTTAGCTATDGIARYNVSFDANGDGTPEEIVVFANGQSVSSGMLPSAPLTAGKKFIGWYNGSNKLENLLQNGKWHAGMPTSFTAKYVDSNDDGVSKLYVYVRFYVKGVQQGYTQLLIDPVTFKDGENMFDWLQHNKGTIGAAITAKDSKYQWYPEYFYNYSGDEILTAQTLKSNGDQSVVVKAYAEAAAEANVMIYVHTSKTTSPTAIYELNGKTAGNTVTLAEVKTLLKNKYTVTQGLYSDKAWTDMLNGLNPMAVNGIDVADNGTLKIHVLAKAGSSNADKSNPKTGDYITIAATAMVLSAAAFVTMVEMKKRKMI